MYLPKDRYIWDFWLCPHGGKYHLFHLQAPRDIPDPELRHGLATVGHAVSEDLIHWDHLGTALGPGRPGEWDDRAIWTGSIVESDGVFYMFYTGTCRAEAGRIQRIGLATSSDLVHWERHPGNPVLEADTLIYERAEDSPFGELAWRDPYVIRWGDGYLALITARRNHGDPQERGCIAVARSKDLTRWEVGPPLDIPGDFAQMEVPQLVCREGRVYLLFSAEAGWIGGAAPRATGTFYTVAQGLFGPYSPAKALLADSRGTFYAAKLIRTFQGSWVALAWIRTGPEGGFVGGLSDPLPVRFDAVGEVEAG